METNFIELLKIQDEVNEVVNERLEESELEKPSMTNYLLAMHVELFEFINEVGIWKWWKQSHKLNKERVLDELADVMAFYLSMMSDSEDLQNAGDAVISVTEENLKDYETDEIIHAISLAIQTGEVMDMSVLMGLAVEIASRTVDASWDEMVEAYKLKSKENISRQERNY